MTGLQLALASGTLLGLGFALLVWRLAPPTPTSPTPWTDSRPATSYPAATTAFRCRGEHRDRSSVDRIGVWAAKNLPGGAWAHTPREDLAILQITETRFYGEKVVWALLGLAIPPLLAALFGLIGVPLPFTIPILGSLGLAALFWFMPNYNATDDAKKARIEFSRALGAYIDMVATGVRDGSSGQQALRSAAEVGDTWVFKRIESELRRARYMTRAPWDSLHGLADDLGVAELDDLADIMQQSGQDGAQIRTTSAPAPRHSAQRCSAPSSARPTPSPSACTSPPACSASSSWRSSSPPRCSASPPDNPSRPLTTPELPQPQKGTDPMLKIYIALQLAALGVTALRGSVVARRRDDRGSVTIEQVIWAVAVIAIVAIVVAAITAFVTSESSKIK